MSLYNQFIWNIPKSLARHINFDRLGVFVKEFTIYDQSNKNDPLVVEFEALMRENPEFYSRNWHQQGPCSNWGVNVFRKETDEEYNLRIAKTIKELPAILKKKAADLKRAKKKFPIKLDVAVDTSDSGNIYPAEIFNRKEENNK